MSFSTCLHTEIDTDRLDTDIDHSAIVSFDLTDSSCHLRRTALTSPSAANGTDFESLLCGFVLQSPSGQLLPSTQYSNGQFLLLLDNPVTAGSYTCKVPQAFASSACIHSNNEQAGEATVSIDSTEGRLLALEVQQRALLAENMELKERLSHMELNHTEQTGQSLHNDSALVQQVQDLGQQLQLQQQQVQDLEQQLQEQNQSSSDLSRQVQDLGEQLQQRNQNSSGLHQQLHDLEQQLHHQRRQVKDLDQLLQQQQLNNSDLYQQVRDLGQGLDQQNQNNSDLYQQVHDLEQQLQQLSQGEKGVVSKELAAQNVLGTERLFRVSTFPGVGVRPLLLLSRQGIGFILTPFPAGERVLPPLAPHKDRFSESLSKRKKKKKRKNKNKNKTTTATT